MSKEPRRNKRGYWKKNTYLNSNVCWLNESNCLIKYEKKVYSIDGILYQRWNFNILGYQFMKIHILIWLLRLFLKLSLKSFSVIVLHIL